MRGSRQVLRTHKTCQACLQEVAPSSRMMSLLLEDSSSSPNKARQQVSPGKFGQGTKEERNQILVEGEEAK